MCFFKCCKQKIDPKEQYRLEVDVSVFEQQIADLKKENEVLKKETTEMGSKLWQSVEDARYLRQRIEEMLGRNKALYKIITELHIELDREGFKRIMCDELDIRK
jgi:hypothetical protein